MRADGTQFVLYGILARGPVPTVRRRERFRIGWHSRVADNGSHSAPASLAEFVFS
jgi:hypothetical protein